MELGLEYVVTGDWKDKIESGQFYFVISCFVTCIDILDHFIHKFLTYSININSPGRESQDSG